MKFIRHLVLRGGSVYVSIPPELYRAMGWQIGDPLCLEALAVGEVSLTPPKVSDLRRAPMTPRTIDLTPVEAK